MAERCDCGLRCHCRGGMRRAETSRASTNEDAPPAEPELALQEIGEFEEPIALTGAKDGSLYVGERAGVVKRFDPDERKKSPRSCSTSPATSPPRGKAPCSRWPTHRRATEIFVTYSGLDKKLHLEAFRPERDASSRRELLGDRPSERGALGRPPGVRRRRAPLPLDRRGRPRRPAPARLPRSRRRRWESSSGSIPTDREARAPR